MTRWFFKRVPFYKANLYVSTNLLNSTSFWSMCGVLEDVRTELAKVPNATVPDLSGWAEKMSGVEEIHKAK